MELPGLDRYHLCHPQVPPGGWHWQYRYEGPCCHPGWHWPHPLFLPEASLPWPLGALGPVIWGTGLMSFGPPALPRPPPPPPRLCEQPENVPMDPGTAVHVAAGGAAPLLPPARALSALAPGAPYRGGATDCGPGHIQCHRAAQVPG